MLRRALSVAILLLLLQSCLTFYQRNLIFHEQFAKRDYSAAIESLEKNKFIQKEKNRLLYMLDKGVVLQMMGNYEESNKIFEEAYIFVDDFQRNVGREALALVSSDMARDYGGEDFEKIFIHYYKAMNFIMMNQYDEAMIEARRINIKLNEINDKYKSDSKYKRDAFAHVLMGLLYEAAGDENNAFIAYRNAYDIYSEDYERFFNIKAPNQLKKDLIRTAAMNGFYDFQVTYEKQFDIKLADIEKSKRELILIWHNGLGPVKDEWSINFVVIKGAGGLVLFENKEFNLSFTFYMRSEDEQASLGDLKVVRVAFPKYSVRNDVFSRAIVKSPNGDHQIELLEDINEIAIKSLHDRMVRELSKTLLRTALKQVAEAAARQENEGLGAAMSILNAVTEKADTRNWQTLPAKISYSRIPLENDSSQLELVVFRGNQQLVGEQFSVSSKNRISFKLSHSVAAESMLMRN